MSTTNLDIRVYPISEPKSNTLAFASIAIDDLAAIRGVRVVNSEKGLFVTMPQSQDNQRKYHDIAFPLSGGLRKEISAAVIAEFEKQANLDPAQRGYEKPEAPISGKNAKDVKLDVKVFPISEPKGNALAFASVGLDDVVAIRGIRIVDGSKGQFISMPQSKDKDGNHRDIAFPLNGDLRREISKAILAEHKQQTAERSAQKQSIKEQIAKGKAQSAQHAAAAPAMSAAKKPPGLGD